MSTRSPKRKPSRMPCLTQALTRHPVGEDGSGSAARTAPGLESQPQFVEGRARRRLVGAGTRGDERFDGDPEACMRDFEAELFQEADDLLLRRLARRHHRQAIDLFAQAHRRHRELHRAGIRLDEVAEHQRHQLVVQLAGRLVVAALGRFHQLRHLGGNGVRRHRDQAAAANRHQRQRQRIVSGQHEEVGRHARGRSRPSA